LLLTSEKKISRKIKEAILASKIEAHLSKEDILFLYLNQIYLGHNAYGVQAASHLYFNKDVDQLNLAESSAFLPDYHRLHQNGHLTRIPIRQKRGKCMCVRMAEEGYITKDAQEKSC